MAYNEKHEGLKNMQGNTTRTIRLNGSMYTLMPDKRIYKSYIKHNVVCIEWINKPSLTDDLKALYAIEIAAVYRRLSE